jgi:uncharacterized protein
MALDLRPNCENCDVDLPPEAPNAMICSFECTFCSDCASQVLDNVCPNCGGGFTPRPIRPHSDWKNGNNLANHPASTTRRHRPVDVQAHRVFAEPIASVAPADR